MFTDFIAYMKQVLSDMTNKLREKINQLLQETHKTINVGGWGEVMAILSFLDFEREVHALILQEKRGLIERLTEEVDDWYSLALAYRNKEELVGKIRSLLLAELSDEEETHE